MDDWAHDEDLYDLSYTETTLPDKARELKKELRQITKEKNEVVCGQDFEKAGELRDQEMDLKTQSSTLVDRNKEMSISGTVNGFLSKHSEAEAAEAQDKICRAIQYGSKFVSNGEPGTAQNVDMSTSLVMKVFCLFKVEKR